METFIYFVIMFAAGFLLGAKEANAVKTELAILKAKAEAEIAALKAKL